MLVAQVACLLALVSFVAPHLTLERHGLAAEVARMVEGVELHLAVLTAVLGLGLWLGRMRWMAAGVVLVALAALVSLSLRVWDRSAPVVPGEPDLTVVWFNAMNDNAVSGERLAEELLALDADVLLFGESMPVERALPALEAAYPHRLGCDAGCHLLALSRVPFDTARLSSIGPVFEERFLFLTFDLPRGPLALIGVHVTKGWYGAVNNGERAQLIARLKRRSRPVVLVGDFNAPPWGEMAGAIHESTGLRVPRLAPPTWPAGAGALGIPIDYPFVGEGVALTALEPFGEGLGSNHRGIRFGISLTD